MGHGGEGCGGHLWTWNRWRPRGGGWKAGEECPVGIEGGRPRRRMGLSLFSWAMVAREVRYSSSMTTPVGLFGLLTQLAQFVSDSVYPQYSNHYMDLLD